MLLEVLHSILQLLTSVANSRNQLVLKVTSCGLDWNCVIC